MGLFSRRSRKDAKAVADECYTRGQWAQALEAYEKVCEQEPENPKILRRVADLRVKLGRKEGAIEAYRMVASAFAESGFLVQAIAIYKILLRLDPDAEDIGRELTELYAKRGFSGPTGRAPAGRPSVPEIPLFSDLDPEAFRQVIDRLIPKALKIEETLFREGDRGDSIWIVTSGSVRVTRGEMNLAELGEGEFFGEGAFFSREPRNADVTAVGSAELLEIRRQDMEGLMARYPGVADALSLFYKRRILDGVLASSPLFGVLPGAERRELADHFRLLRVSAGEAVVREGDVNRSLYLVKGGRFRVAATPPGGGDPVVLAELGVGAFFGEVALIGGTPRTATVTSVAEGELLQIEARDMAPVLEAHPEVRQVLEQARDERAADTVATFLGRKP